MMGNFQTNYHEVGDTPPTCAECEQQEATEQRPSRLHYGRLDWLCTSCARERDRESYDLDEAWPKRPRLTRHERLQAMADAGIDTWDDYHGVK